ncbi:hypothetical protein [Streptomyces sp. AK02-04a]|nr:hypothetical protein [Streptomyces sp. AK02-04a]
MIAVDWSRAPGLALPLLYLTAIAALGVATAVHLYRNRRNR